VITGGRGMTLLELIVGITVTGMAVTAGLAAVAALADRRRQMETAGAETARGAEQREEIAAWLGGARLVADEGGPVFKGLDGLFGHVPSDELGFLTTSPTPLGTGQTIVRLYVDRDTMTLERGLVASFFEWQGKRNKRVQLDSAVTGLDIRYLSGVLGPRAWLPSWISSTMLPAAVQIRLIAAPGDTLQPLLQMPILVPLRGR
jgi:type II secretory pathway pseudopilin PulG